MSDWNQIATRRFKNAIDEMRKIANTAAKRYDVDSAAALTLLAELDTAYQAMREAYAPRIGADHAEKTAVSGSDSGNSDGRKSEIGKLEKTASGHSSERVASGQAERVASGQAERIASGQAERIASGQAERVASDKSKGVASDKSKGLTLEIAKTRTPEDAPADSRPDYNMNPLSIAYFVNRIPEDHFPAWALHVANRMVGLAVEEFEKGN